MVAVQSKGYNQIFLKPRIYMSSEHHPQEKFPQEQTHEERIPREKLERSGVGETLPEIEEAQSFKELFAALEKIGVLKGTRRDYSAEELKKRIEDVMKTPLPILLEKITRAGGLRKKVEELLKTKGEQYN